MLILLYDYKFSMGAYGQNDLEIWFFTNETFDLGRRLFTFGRLQAPPEWSQIMFSCFEHLKKI